MKAKRGFPKKTLAAIRDGKILGIRAGTKAHRIIGIWAVVVENRVFVRSWSLKPRSWYRTFLEEPRGVIEVEGRQIPVRAVFTRSEPLKSEVRGQRSEVRSQKSEVRRQKAEGRRQKAEGRRVTDSVSVFH